MTRSKKVLISVGALITVIVIILIGINVNQSIKADEITDTSFTEPSINYGLFYLNGDTSKCYFEINENTLKLYGTKEQYKELYKFEVNIHKAYTFDEWYVLVSGEWELPVNYIIHTAHGLEKTFIAYNPAFDSNGKLSSSTTFDYIDESNFVAYSGNFVFIANETNN